MNADIVTAKLAHTSPGVKSNPFVSRVDLRESLGVKVTHSFTYSLTHSLTHSLIVKREIFLYYS